MSLYNALFGVNEMAPMLMKMAGVEPNEVARFRDCYVEDGKIVIYTRTGGGNRECYAGSDEDCANCYHTFNDSLAARPNYVTDYDDDFDPTYAYFVFNPLEEYKGLVAGLSASDPGVGEKFKTLIERMKA